MEQDKFISSLILLPDLECTEFKKVSNKKWIFQVHKTNPFEVCPKCASKSYSVYDHRLTTPKDAPIRNKRIKLSIKKRRFKCPNCSSIFTEPVSGIKKGFRTTERFRNSVLKDCELYSNLSDVKRVNRCSNWLVYKIFYERLELEIRKFQDPWASTIGIDEHSFLRSKKGKGTEFVTSFVEYGRNRIREVTLGRDVDSLKTGISHIPGKENVKNVIIDMSSSYRSFITSWFPKATIIADKFHVLRLITPLIRKYRKKITGDDRKNPIRNLLLMNSKKLEKYQKKVIKKFINQCPRLTAIYEFKERLNGFYRIKGFKVARKIFIRILDDMALSSVPEIKTIRKTLLSWKNEILAYFKTGLTNGRTEGFNRKAKLVQRKAFGFRTFSNYRLRLLCACR